MKTRMALRIAAVAVLGALVIGGIAGTESAEAASISLPGPGAIDNGANHVIVAGTQADLASHSNAAGTDLHEPMWRLRLRSAGIELTHLPATKGGRYP